MPSELEQKKATEMLRESFGTEMDSSDTSVRQKAAERFLKQAGSSENTPAMRYVLLIEAARLFAQVPDIPNVTTALGNLSETFSLPHRDVQLDILQNVRKHCRTPEQFDSLALAYRSIIDSATQAWQLEDAVKASHSFIHAAKFAKNPALFKEATLLRANLRKLRETQKRAKSAQKILSQGQNPKANQIVGEYLCLIKGDWNAGLPHLTKAANKELAQLAQADLNNPQTPDECVALGDAYFELGREESWSVKKDHYLGRARMYYEKALPELGGIQKERANKRIEQCAEVSMQSLPQNQASSFPKSLRKGLVLHYSFDAQPQETVEDKSGKKHNGEPWGIRWMSTDMDTAVDGFCSFDGRAAITIPCPMKLGTGNITIAFWTKRNTIRGYQYLFSNKSDYYDNFLRIGLDRDSTKIRVYSEEDRNRHIRSVSPYALDDRWHHLVLVRQADTGMLYADGRLVDTLPMNKGNIGVESEWCIGGGGGKPHPKWPDGFKGYMDEVAVWNHALSKREVRQLYRCYGNTYSPRFTQGQVTLDVRGKALLQFITNSEIVSWTGKKWSQNVRDSVKLSQTKNGVALHNEYEGHHMICILFPLPCKPGMTMTVKGQGFYNCGVLDADKNDNWVGIKEIKENKPEVIRAAVLEKGFQFWRNGEIVNPKEIRNPEVGYFMVGIKRGKTCHIQRIQFTSQVSRKKQ